MEIEQETLRRNVETQIAVACASGPWEGRYLDFKEKLDGSRAGLGKMLKLLLAFANTPRNRDAYIIYGVTDRDRPVRHVGVESFPSKEQIEELCREYTDLEGIVVDSEFSIGPKRTPFLVIPIQFTGPYRLKRELRDARDVVKPSRVYFRNGSCIAVAGERELLRMKEWDTWALDGRYVSSIDELQRELGRIFPTYSNSEIRDGYIRRTFTHISEDEFGRNRRSVLIHAYPGLGLLGVHHIQALVTDNLGVAHDKWLIAQGLQRSALAACESAGIRFISIDDLFLANDVYARYCSAFLRWWDSERAKSLTGTVIDLDFRTQSSGERSSSVLSWLVAGLRTKERVPILLSGEFGTGKTITARQLVADICETYRRRASDLRAIYVNLNSMDIRAARSEFVERALLSLDLSRADIDDLVRLVENDHVNLVFDAVDEMARPYSAAGRKEALDLIRDNTNQLPCLVTARSNYFSNEGEMQTWFAELAPPAFAKALPERSARVCELTDRQVEDLLEGGLENEEEPADSKSVARSLREMGLGSFLRDPLVLSLCIELLRQRENLRVAAKPGKVQLIKSLLDRIIAREDEKRWRHRGPLGHGRFHKLLTWVAYTMIRDERLFFGIEQVQQFVQGQLSAGENDSEDIVREMSEEFRTRTWLHAEDGQYCFRHPVFTVVLAATFILDNLTPGGAQNLGEWNRESSNAETVVACARDLLTPLNGMSIAACLQKGKRPASIERLVGELLNDTNLSARACEQPKWLDAPDLPSVMGSAIKAASEQPSIAAAVMSCIIPLVQHSSRALQGAICYLALQKPESLTTPATFNQVLKVLSALWGLRKHNSYQHLPFEDLIKETETIVGNDDRLLTAAGLTRRDIANPFTYHAQFGELRRRLQRDQPDAPTHTYIVHAADYLTGYTSSKRQAIQSLHPRPHRQRR